MSEFPKFCVNCGAPLEEGQRFCVSCGAPQSTPTVEQQPAMPIVPETQVPMAPNVPVQPAAEAAMCATCGAPLDDAQHFCVNCGAARSMPVQAAATPVAPPMPTPAQPICTTCGAPLVAGQLFCDNCGAPVAIAPPAPAPKKKSPLVPILIAVGGAVTLLIGLLVVWLMLPRVEQIQVNEVAVEIKLDETFELECTVFPANAIDGKVEWESSDVSVASVDDDGTVYANGEGSCIVYVSAGDCEIAVDVTVTDGPDFVTLFYTVLGDDDDTYLSDDGSYITIDTNVYNLDDYTRWSTLDKIEEFHEALGLPDSVYGSMLETRSLDGRQTYQADGFTVSWTYHPDKGLEVMYALD